MTGADRSHLGTPPFDFATLNDPGDGDSPSGDALIAHHGGDHEPLARVLERVAATLSDGSRVCALIAADYVRRAQKGRPGRKPVRAEERIGRLIGNAHQKAMSPTQTACFFTEQILADLRRLHPKRRKISGASGVPLWSKRLI
jgi:hypothetical protein